MILDKIENLVKYRQCGCSVEIVQKFLEKNDFNKLALGRYELDNGVILNLMEYQTKSEKAPRFEKHEKYIDIQYMIAGKELIYWNNVTDGEMVRSYSEEQECSFWVGNYENHFCIKQEYFCVFFPADLHAPSNSVNKCETVKKAVFKIPLC